MDRFIQQAVMQVLQAHWDPTFSESSFGFRPGRNAHQAVKRAQSYLKEGYTWVVDMDLEKFFDRVNHDKLMSEVSKRVRDRRVLALIHRFLRAGAMEHDELHETPEAVKRLKERVRDITRRTRGRRIECVVQELRRYLLGWKAYFGYAEVRSIFKEWDSWIQRRLRGYLWKQWGRRGDKALRKRGVSRDLAWNTAKSAHGPWRISRSPALAIALPGSHFDGLGVPRLYIKGSSQPNRRGT